MLFKDLRTEQGGNFQHLHIVGQGVVGVADDVLREMADEGRDHAERGVFVHRGVIQHAVEQGQRIALGFNPAHGLGYFSKAGRPGGHDDGLLEVAHEFNEGAVREVRRGDFEHIHHVVEEFGGLHVERGGHEGDTGLIAVLFQVFEFAFPEGVVLFEQLVLALEFDGVRAAEGGFVDEAAGDVHAAFMVHTGFGDDVGTLEAGDRDGVLADEVDEVHKTLREKVRWLRENRGYPCLVPLPRTPVKWRKPASKPCG